MLEIDNEKIYKNVKTNIFFPPGTYFKIYFLRWISQFYIFSLYI